MRSFGVEPDEIFRQLVIKGNGIFEQIGMMVNEFFLDSPVETFALRVQLRGFGISVPVA